MTEHLGTRKVSRSACAVQEATPTAIYLGVCERDQRPVRFEMPADLGPVAEIPCFAGCTLPVRCERLHAVTITLECDGSCRSARRASCECGCGGLNHGNIWTRGALLDQREVVESAIEQYRAGQARITQRREARREAAARRERSAFQTWAAEHQDLITALDPWYEHRTDDAWLAEHGYSRLLEEFAIQTHGGWNGKPKPLTEGQAEWAWKILREKAGRQQAEAEAAARPAPEGTKIPVTGEIVKVKASEGYAGEIHYEATVRCEGYAVRVTVPKAIVDWGRDNRSEIIHAGWRPSYQTDWHGIGERWTQALRGTRIAFTAGEIRQWAKDNTLGFAKRPTQVTFTPPEPGTGTEREAS